MHIIIIDDDHLVTSSLKTIVEAKGIHVDAIGHSGEEACILYAKYQPDVVLMDIRMQGMNGVEASEQILQQDKNAKILFLTTFSDDEYIVKALQLGVKGYILKQNFECILPSLEAVVVGQNVFNTEIITKLPNLIQTSDDTAYQAYELTKREQMIVSLVAQGLNNKEIANTLFLSEGTIRNYLSTLLDKLHLRDRTQLAVFFYQNIQNKS